MAGVIFMMRLGDAIRRHSRVDKDCGGDVVASACGGARWLVQSRRDFIEQRKEFWHRTGWLRHSGYGCDPCVAAQWRIDSSTHRRANDHAGEARAGA